MSLVKDLNAILALESRGALSRISELTPYLTPTTMPKWLKVQTISHAASNHADRVSAIITSLDQTPGSATYPIDSAGMHYLRLDALLPLLIDERRRQVANYTRAVASAANSPAAAEIQALADENQRALHDLEALAA